MTAVHTFGSTQEAYNASQVGTHYNEESGIPYPVESGDILLIPSECVVGIADTYPIAITIRRGELHSLATGYTLETCPEAQTPFLEAIVNGHKVVSHSQMTLDTLRANVKDGVTIAENNKWCIAHYVDVV